MRGRLTLVIALLGLALAGCGSFVRLAYNNADFGVRMLANEYFDPDVEQANLLRESIGRFHAWHRRAEMPQYAAMLDSVSDRLRRGLTADDVGWASTSIQDSYRRLVGRAIADATPLLERLTPENLATFERKLAESNEKFERDYALDNRERQKSDRLKALGKRYREWLGELTAQQEALLDQYAAVSPGFFTAQLEERKRRQSIVLSVLRSGAPAAEVAARLRDQLVDYKRHRSPDYQMALQAWERRLNQLLLDMERSLTPQQRAHLLDRIARYAKDFRVLAGDGKQPPAARSPAEPWLHATSY